MLHFLFFFFKIINIDITSNFSNLLKRDHFHNLNKKEERKLPLSSKHVGIRCIPRMRPLDIALFAHLWSACLSSKQFVPTFYLPTQFFFSSSFFIYELRSLSLSLWPSYYRDNKRRDRGWWKRYRGSPVPIEAAMFHPLARFRSRYRLSCPASIRIGREEDRWNFFSRPIRATSSTLVDYYSFLFLFRC